MQMGLRNDPRRGQNTLHGSYQIWLPVLYCKYDARAHKLFQSKYIKIQEPRLSLSLSLSLSLERRRLQVQRFSRSVQSPPPIIPLHTLD